MVTARSGARPSRQQDEELVVTNADLGDAARAPPRAESGDGKRRFGTRPALNVKLAVSYATRDAGIHIAHFAVTGAYGQRRGVIIL
jgi:hypothetical protein